MQDRNDWLIPWLLLLAVITVAILNQPPFAKFLFNYQNLIGAFVALAAAVYTVRKLSEQNRIIAKQWTLASIPMINERACQFRKIDITAKNLFEGIRSASDYVGDIAHAFDFLNDDLTQTDEFGKLPQVQEYITLSNRYLADLKAQSANIIANREIHTNITRFYHVAEIDIREISRFYLNATIYRQSKRKGKKRISENYALVLKRTSGSDFLTCANAYDEVRECLQSSIWHLQDMLDVALDEVDDRDR